MKKDRNTWLTLLVTLTAVGILAAYCLPFLLMGDNAFITIHDNMDGELLYKYLLVKSGTAFNFDSATVVQNVMDGLPRSAYRTGFDVTLLLFYLFLMHWAYIVNYIIVHVFAFLGMWFLLRRHVIPDERARPLAVSVALLFALIPFYTQFGLSVAGQPLLLYSFLNILKNRYRPVDFLIIGAFPLYSHIGLVAPFIVAAMCLLLIGYRIQEKKFNGRAVLAISLMASVYMLIDWSIIYAALFGSGFVSQRTAYTYHFENLTVSAKLQDFFDILTCVHYHPGTLFTGLIAESAVVAAVSIYASERRFNRWFVVACVTIPTLSFIAAFQNFFIAAIDPIAPFFNTFQISRVYFLLPLLWMLLFAVCLDEMRKKKVLGAAAAVLIILQLGCILNSNAELKNNVKLLLGRKIDVPTYRQFFAPDLFAKVAKFIGKPQEDYRVVSVGMHPSVAQFNGFYTLDSYQVIYDLNYKKRFRHIIEKELDKSEKIRSYFDGWGNRCYVFSHELGLEYLYGKDSGKEIRDLSLNTEALKSMGGEYVLSSVPILNYAENRLRFEGKFTDKNSWWDVYLYRVTY
jgi:hypothetical protein